MPEAVAQGRGTSADRARLDPRRIADHWSQLPAGNRKGLMSIGWAGLTQVTALLIRLASNLILTRLLVPSDYGLFGTATAVLTTMEWLCDLGIHPALIRHPDGMRPEYLSTGWWINVSRGAMLMVLAWALTVPLSIYWFDQRGLVPILLALSLRPFLLTLRSPGYPALRRELRYRGLFFDEFTQTIAQTVVGVVIAWLYHSIWAIVFGTLVGTVVTVVNSYILCRVRPRLIWDAHVVKEISHFSRQVVLNTFVMALWSNQAQLFGLRYVGGRKMGIYVVAGILAYHLEMMFARGCDVYFSLLSRRTDLKEREALHRAVGHRLANWGMPLMALGILLAPVVIALLYDPRYAAAGLIFAIFVARLMVRALGQVQFQYLLSLAHVRINTVAYFCAFLVQAALFVPMAKAWGIVGMAVVTLISTTVLAGTQYVIAWRRHLDGIRPFLVTLGWMGAGLVSLALLPASLINPPEPAPKPEPKGQGRPILSRDHRADVRRVDRSDHSALGDDARDQSGGRDVEGRIVNGHSIGRGLPAEPVGHFARVSLFDRDRGPVGERQVERARRRGDVERDAVGLCQERNAVGADLVGRVAVGRDPVRAHDGDLDLPFLHDLRGHAVADQGYRNSSALEFPGGQP
jgi:O-antigen/teichoic acid export membrane protein